MRRINYFVTMAILLIAGVAWAANQTLLDKTAATSIGGNDEIYVASYVNGTQVDRRIDITNAMKSALAGVNWDDVTPVKGAGTNWVDYSWGMANAPADVNWVDADLIAKKVTASEIDVPEGESSAQSLTVGTGAGDGSGTNLFGVDENGMLNCKGRGNCGINWADFEKVSSAGMNWVDVDAQELSAEGINWVDIQSQEVYGAGLNWTDYFSLPSAAVNWAQVQEIQTGSINWVSINADISSAGINWSDMYTNTAEINWGGSATFGGTGQSDFSASGFAVNWDAVTPPVTNGGINWSDVEQNAAGVNWYQTFQCNGLPCF